MVADGELKVPVIGVAKSGWGLEQLKERAATAWAPPDGHRPRGLPQAADAPALRRRRLRRRGHLRRAAPPARHGRSTRCTTSPSRPSLFEHGRRAARRQRLRRRRPGRDREAVRPRPGVGRRAQRRRSTTVFAERDDLPHRPLPREGGGGEPLLLPLRQHASSSRSGTGTTSRASRSRWPRTFGVDDRGAFYDATGAIRDVVQNHLLQLVALLTMEPPARFTPEALHRAQLDVFEGLRPLRAERRRARPVPRLQEGEGRQAGVDGRDLRRHAPPPRHVALERRADLRAGRQVPAGHRHRDHRRPAPAAPGRLRRDHPRALQLRPVPDRRRDEPSRSAPRSTTPTSARARTSSCYAQRKKTKSVPAVRAAAHRRDARQPDAVQRPGRGRRDVADRRPDPRRRHAGAALQAGHLGAGRGRPAWSPTTAAGGTRVD